MSKAEENFSSEGEDGTPETKMPPKSALLIKLENLQRSRAQGFLQGIMAHEEIEKMVLDFLMPPVLQGPDMGLLEISAIKEMLKRMDSGGGVVVPHGTSVQPRSALDTWARMEAGDFDWRDATTPAALDAYGLRGEQEGPFPNMSRTVTFVELGANGIASSHVTAIGAEVARFEGKFGESIYVRFKGGKLYRYTSLDGEARYAALLLIASNMSKALPCELTVGEYIERVLKAGHENGLINCESLDSDGVWRPALKRSEVKRKRRGPADESGVPNL